MDAASSLQCTSTDGVCSLVVCGYVVGDPLAYGAHVGKQRSAYGISSGRPGTSAARGPQPIVVALPRICRWLHVERGANYAS